jgi:hypothetical protein
VLPYLGGIREGFYATLMFMFLVLLMTAHSITQPFKGKTFEFSKSAYICSIRSDRGNPDHWEIYYGRDFS